MMLAMSFVCCGGAAVDVTQTGYDGRAASHRPFANAAEHTTRCLAHVRARHLVTTW